MSAGAPPARRTPLYAEHAALGGRLIDFAGWELPVQYRGIVEEHRQVRSSAGLFDLSHMGEMWAVGRPPVPPRVGARERPADPRAGPCPVLHHLRPGRWRHRRPHRVPHGAGAVPGRAQRGNASIVAAEPRGAGAGFDATVDDASDRRRSSRSRVPAPWASFAPSRTRPSRTALVLRDRGRVAGAGAWVARTGYTGEDGFELFLDDADAVPVWRALLAAAPDGELQPVGLGARDTLRLEAGMPLYGNELDRDTHPEEARLGRVVKLDKPGGFVGRDALASAAARGPRKLLVGLVLREPGIARHGYPVLEAAATPDVPGPAIGIVTSGSHSPSLGEAIAMAYVPPALAFGGTMVRVGIRTTVPTAEVVELPFHRRPRQDRPMSRLLGVLDR